MVRTRVGYAGGEKENPSYRSLGGHSETIQIDYDPAKISYQELLDVFWDSHNPVFHTGSRQYMSIVFYHNDEQKGLASDAKEREENLLGRNIITEIVPFSEFYLAEDYHQKYYLRQERDLMPEMSGIYPAAADFMSSTTVARINGYVGGYGRLATLQAESNSFGLSEAGRNKLLQIADRGLVPGCGLP